VGLDVAREVAQRRKDEVDGGGLAFLLVRAAAGGDVLQPAEEAGGDRLGPVVHLVGADVLLEVGGKKVEVAALGFLGAGSLGLGLQLLVEAPAAGEAVGVLDRASALEVIVSQRLALAPVGSLASKPP
jgi:hypothetical protein